VHSFATASLKIGAKVLRSPEDFIVKEVSSRKGITFYTFLIKRAGFAPGLLPTIYVRWQGPRVSLKTFLAVLMIFRISCGECSSRFSKRQSATARVGIRRAVN
jgi:hypothetical protein